MKDRPTQPFGTLLGYAPGEVPVYSSDYETASSETYPSRKSFRSYHDGIYMGYKWQCVEFARRWLYVNFDCIFDDVAMAYDIFDLRTIRHTKTKEILPLNAFANGALQRPEFGSLLIWQEGGEFEETGHVAVVTEVTDDYIRVAEQNVGHMLWEGRDYARQLATTVGENGEYWIKCSYGDAQILGWMTQTENTEHAEPTDVPNKALNTVLSKHAKESQARKKTFLNIANPDEAAYVSAMNGHCLTQIPSEQTRYFLASKTASENLEKATNELHGMFMHATDYVLEHESLLKKFNLPEAILPKIKQSWDNRLNELITSRFDFALTEQGLKVYEYNCDSASCYMEAGKVQGKWALNYSVTEGLDAGQNLFHALVRTWRKSQAKGLVHILRDDDPEEAYHALFMQAAIEAAGLTCHIIDDLSTIEWRPDGALVDQTGATIQWVWKTWAWETALDELRLKLSENNPSDSGGDSHSHSKQAQSIVQLSDILFHPAIMVYEPLWSLIPSNKAILPVLWTLFPNHPLLLNTSFELNDDLRATGYVKKPIVGRCGANISLVDSDNTVLSETLGVFAHQDNIYQQFWPLPKIDEYYTQLCTFTAGGLYAGSGVRADKDMIIRSASDCMPLRIVDDALLIYQTS